TLDRGRAYFRSGAVLECVAGDDGLSVRGKVSGSRSRPYRVVVNFGPGGAIDCECTCPVGWNCKHGAALTLTYLSDRSTTAEAHTTISPAIKSLSICPADSQVNRDIVYGIDLLARLCSSTHSDAGALPTAGGTSARQLVIYVLSPTWQHELCCEVYTINVLSSGSVGMPMRSDAYSIARAGTACAEDLAVCRLWANNSLDTAYLSDLPKDQEIREMLIRRMVASGRCYWNEPSNPPLTMGDPLAGHLQWLPDEAGNLCLRIAPDLAELAQSGMESAAGERAGTGGASMESAGGFYIDTSRWVIGPLRDKYPAELKEHLALLPAVQPDQALAVSLLMQERSLAGVVPFPSQATKIDVELVKAKPSLWLEARRQVNGEPLAIAIFALSYDDHLQLETPEAVEDETTGEQRAIVRRKDISFEKECISRLRTLGFREVASHRLAIAGRGAPCYEMSSIANWAAFLEQDVENLRSEGWDIRISPSFSYRVVEPDDDWDIDIEEGAGWWFSLELGIMVEGERVSLLPLIAEALRNLNPGNPLASLDALTIRGKFFLPLSDGRLVSLPLERVLPLIEVLIELFDKDSVDEKGRVPLLAPLLVALMERLAAARGNWASSAKLGVLRQGLAKVGERKIEADLRDFKASLREYQVHGLAWLQFLREAGLGGILADDMGLGKTVQTLAHVWAEKSAGRLTAPYLVVCPTSVLPNWAAEAARFCPRLTVLCHHGKERSRNGASLKEHDLVVTSYAVLLRDARHFIKQRWHGIILDEAQSIKNPVTAIAKTVRALTASHRVCLTGTPIQNHLGDLWSQFEFLMPGLLGDTVTFKRLFRDPIEKVGDQLRARALSTRVKPFVLRRTKEEVAAELPEKTIIVKSVELEGAQRDLYETVRLAMHEKVLEEIASKGLARSQIVILEAMLRLRQACCDPALVKLEAARNVTESAKRAALIDMLAELIESGRRVLLFSQFTSMLDLIKSDLGTLGLKYVELTGSTVDREEPVSRFQRGDVPLFLLSLKAGGTGLNLTAADTVIHYDPWWNPYVEDQATDRAHRIGQDKPVFVYKLIARGTIEERMLELQRKKRHVAEAILSHAGKKGLQLTEQELNLLFQPISTLAVEGAPS
ncbi:MAG TPA: DEAD/DEAH box helicase, partial [Candidatus Obscuribacterales bacterium]